MVGDSSKVVWSANAKKQLKAAYKFIAKDSPQAARGFSAAIAAITRRLPGNPEFYPPDKYKLQNDTSYRAFEKHHYRISYRVLLKEIRILRMRHTRMVPKNY